MSEGSTHLLRGRQLRDHNRFEEAEAFFRQAIAADPDDANSYSELALCQLSMDGRRKDALASIDDAIARDPDNDRHHSLRSLILSKLNRSRDALAAADRAIAINPDDAYHFAAKAQAYSTQSRWSDAETAARQALTLDADNEHAKNILAVVLRLQGKQWESEVAASGLLADDPEDPYAHYNAGWAALQAHDSKKAEEHFREALRLDASFDEARAGLLESFKARSGFYRIYLRYCFWMQRFTDGARWGLIIGLYLCYQFGRHMLSAISPLAAGLFIAAYLIFVVWVWLAGGVGSALVMLDKSARHALKTSEKLEGLAVGGGLVVALVVFVCGAVMHHAPAMIFGGLIAASTIPAALTFTNEQPRGQRLFGGIWLGVLAVGLYVFAVETVRGSHSYTDFASASDTLLMIAILAAVATTWIGNIPSLRMRSD